MRRLNVAGSLALAALGLGFALPAAASPSACAGLRLVMPEAATPQAASKSAEGDPGPVPPRQPDGVAWRLTARGPVVTGTLELRFDAREGDAPGELQIGLALPSEVVLGPVAIRVAGDPVELQASRLAPTKPQPDARAPGGRRAPRPEAAPLRHSWRGPVTAAGDVVLTAEVELDAALSAGAFRLELPAFRRECGGDVVEPADLALALDVLGAPRLQLAGESEPALVLEEGDDRTRIVLDDSSPPRGAAAIRVAWRLQGEDETAPRAWSRTRADGRREVTLVVAAPAEPDAAAIRAKDVTFVLDASGSMAAEGKLAEASRAVASVLGSLPEEDGTWLLVFSDSVRGPGEAPVTGTAAREEAAAFLGSLQAQGGTQLAPALQRALPAQREGGQALVVVLSDGQLSDEKEVLPLLQAASDDVRLLLVAIGADADRGAMRRMAEAARGEALVAASPSAIVDAVSSLVRSFGRALAWDVRIEWDGLTPATLQPARVPDLHADRPLVLRAVFDAGTRLPARLRVRGTTQAGEDGFDVFVPVEEQAGAP